MKYGNSKKRSVNLSILLFFKCQLFIITALSMFIDAQISDLKLALERKEAELHQIKGGTRNAVDPQKSRAVSPYRLPRGINKQETCQRPLDDAKIYEVICTYMSNIFPCNSMFEGILRCKNLFQLKSQSRNAQA